MGLPAPVVAEVVEALRATVGRGFRVQRTESVGGGCINQAWLLVGQDGQRVFLKCNRADKAETFAAEAAGLEALARAEAIRVPAPLALGCGHGLAWLALEYLPLGGAENAALMGRQLAAMHRVTQPKFGWHRDNTLGATPQPNTGTPRWVDFYRTHRLGYQLGLAKDGWATSRVLDMGERLMANLEIFFDGYVPLPSLLHGDLWGGNAGYLKTGEPVVFDPAVYFGDREADVAMTELFGGFSASFLAAYREAWPLDSGYPERRNLYNLYHILNHAHLFGGGYVGQAERMLTRLLAAS